MACFITSSEGSSTAFSEGVQSFFLQTSGFPCTDVVFTHWAIFYLFYLYVPAIMSDADTVTVNVGSILGYAILTTQMLLTIIDDPVVKEAEGTSQDGLLCFKSMMVNSLL
ncbi:hypothetical protein Pelo_14761 [Pelomyxa schiedti]|nr:hypothetical protein Pelo_14761 [Pelomyxa schiedti]